ncbi:MAG: NADH-quinone oxidoreductase subunit M [Gammaproteobacteria bacterium]|nr:NADH-quinone oxidoreductase subunit M [Gammaproteobacteria bacterium]
MLLWLIAVLAGGGVLAWLSERMGAAWPQRVALLVLAVAAVCTAMLWIGGADAAGLYALTDLPWIPRFGIGLVLALDGLSLLLVALTVLLGAVAVISSWTEISQRHGLFQLNLLMTLAGVVGVFTALDLFAFFVFWEVMLVPMYLLIAIWGHEERGYASMKFFLFTQISGLLLLVAIIALVLHHQSASGVLTFDYRILLGAAAGVPAWIMLGFLAAFLTKLPGVPLHTWLPDAHTQAPTAGSVILAGIMLKTGAYGLIRFVVPLFPEASLELRYPIMLLGAVSVVYGAYVAFAQDDFKRLVAYSSISHMGFVLLGVFAWNQVAVQGAVVQMVAHGFSTAALFMMAGALQERLHTRDLARMGGLWGRAPRMGAVTLFFVVASLGMPGLGNFVGEFMVLVGAFQVNVELTVLAALGLVVAAAYALLLMQRSFQGSPGGSAQGGSAPLQDFGAREMAVMLVLAAALVWLGVYPQPLLDLSGPVLEGLGTGRGALP